MIKYFVIVFMKRGKDDFSIITMSSTTDEQEHIDQVAGYKKYYGDDNGYFVREHKENM